MPAFTLDGLRDWTHRLNGCHPVHGVRIWAYCTVNTSGRCPHAAAYVHRLRADR
jgi:hypothetical protein